MKCYYHNGSDAVATCTDCGKSLCRSCAERYSPVLCPDCANERIQENKSNITTKLILSVVLFIGGIIAFIIFNNGFNLEAFGAAYCFAALPWGWGALNRVTPDIFLIMPIIGWLVYFIIKAFLAIIIGWIVMPIKIIKSISELKSLNSMQ